MPRQQGQLVVMQLGDSIIECRGAGYLRRTDATVAQAAIERILATREQPFDTLFDGSDVSGFELGLPMFWVRWTLDVIHRIRRSAIVGRPGPLLAVARPFPYLLPGLALRLFENRSDALAFLHQTSA